jgi:hypothetical protein
MATDEEFRALQERVDRLERVVAGADADVAAIQAQRRADLELLMALRGTQLSQDERIGRLEQTVAAGFEEMRAGFTGVHAGLQAITGLITRSMPDNQ